MAKSAFQKCNFGKIRENGLEVKQSWKMREEAKRKNLRKGHEKEAKTLNWGNFQN